MLSSDTLDSGKQQASCIEVGVVEGVEYIFANKDGVSVFDSDNLRLLKSLRLSCASPSFLLWRGNVLFCGTTSSKPAALTMHSLRQIHEQSVDSGFYCQHDLSFDLDGKRDCFFSCNKSPTSLLKQFHRRLGRVWMFKGHNGSVYSTTCSRGYVAEVYSGCYSCILLAHDLRTRRCRRKKQLPSWGGISTILPFKSDRFAFVGFASSKVALVSLRDLSIVHEVSVNSSVYAMDLDQHRLVIGGTNNSFYSIAMEEVEKYLEE